MKPRWSDVERIFHDALDRPKHERHPFLDRVCGDDTDLRSEVQSLLDQGSSPGFMDQPAVQVAAEIVGGRSAAPLTGRQIGVYEIGLLLGAGGMGEVYRARDVRLGRDVALKFLPPAFTTDPDRLARFEREARLLAALNHPHIGAIYGIEEADGIRALVLELVEGDTLADRVATGAVPVRHALVWARQIADALDAAHDKGIVHRDLKPANVKITPSGVIKVLDFGLARPDTGRHDSANLSLAPTITADAGIILGTAAYMSPEQARGETVDKRSDVWAFGCVLYELLTGRLAFPASTVSDTLAAILREEPEWKALPRGLPSGVSTLLRRCLDKDVTRRRRDIGDVRAELDDGIARLESGVVEQDIGGGESTPRNVGGAKTAVHSNWLMLSAIAVIVVGSIAWLSWRDTSDSTGPGHDLRLSLLVPPGMQFPEKNSQLAVSSDGKMVAYVASSGGRMPQLILRKLDTNTDQPIAEAINPRHPFFSPDGQWVGFFPDNRIVKTSVADGRSQEIGRADLAETGWWGQGFILFGAGGDLGSEGIRRLPEKGGTVEVLTRPDKSAGELNHNSPQLLPDGQTLLYTARRAYGPHPAARLMIKRAGAAATVLLEDAQAGQYIGNSILIYQQGRSLFATHLNVDTLAVSGRGELLFDDVSMDGRPRWTAGGDLLVYRSLLYRSENDGRQFVWVDRHGQEVPLPAPPRRYAAPSLSPKGDRIAVEIEDEGKFDIWTLDPDRPGLRQITFDGASRYPIWTPDGAHIGVVHRRQNKLYWLTPDGRESRDLVQGKFSIWFGSWAPDMRTLVYMEDNDLTRSDVWAVDPRSKAEPQSIVQSKAREYAGRISPDGRWLTYFSDESGQYQLYLRPLIGGQPVQISSGDKRSRPREAVWSRNNRQLEVFYRQGPEMMVVPVPGGGRPPLGPIRVFQGDYYSIGGPGIVNFDVAPDGRFLMLKPVENHTPHLTVVQGLNRLARERLQPIVR